MSRWEMDLRSLVHGFNPLSSEEGTQSSNNVGDGEKRTLERESRRKASDPKAVVRGTLSIWMSIWMRWQPQVQGHKHADMLKMGSHSGDRGKEKKTWMQESTNGPREQGGSMEERCSLWEEERVERSDSRQEGGRKEACGVLKDRDLEGWEQSRATEFSIRSKDVSLLFHCFPMSWGAAGDTEDSSGTHGLCPFSPPLFCFLFVSWAWTVHQRLRTSFVPKFPEMLGTWCLDGTGRHMWS